jgi:Flp pilus assembly protein protease CpaA
MVVATAVVFTMWQGHIIGGGDAKLWMALIWAVSTPVVLPALFLTFASTGALQLAVRALRHQKLTGIKAPGAWRALPFLAISSWWAVYAAH